MQTQINSKISIEKIRKDAEEMFFGGGFTCSEAVVSSIRNNIDPSMPGELVSAASGFSGGVGRAKCICGTVSGAVICLGYFFGRPESADATGYNSRKMMAVAFELQESFRSNHKVLCCSVHQKAAEKAGIELRTQCCAFVGEVAEKAAEIIARELGKSVCKNSPAKSKKQE